MPVIITIDNTKLEHNQRFTNARCRNTAAEITFYHFYRLEVR